MCGQVFPFLILVKPVMRGNRVDGLQKIRGLPLSPGRQGPIGKLQRLIGNNQPFIKEQFNPQTIAVRTGPKGGVERKQARLDLGDREATDRTSKFF